MTKTLKIADKTHSRLMRQGNTGETFDDIINKLIDIANQENLLLLYRFTNKEPPRQLYLANPMYYWTDDNYKKFFEMASQSFPGWVDDIVKRIAENEELYKKVIKYRDEQKLKVRQSMGHV